MSGGGSIDLATYRDLLDRTLKSSVTGVAPGSSTGEAPYLTVEERRELLEVTVDHVAGRVSVIASAAATSTAEAIGYAQHAEQAGADVVLANLVQFFRLSREEIHQHFLAVAEATKLPVLLYNQPLTGVDLDPDLIAGIASEASNVRGVKEASGLVGRMTTIQRLTSEDFAIYCGHGDVSLPAFLLGARGWFTALANLVPDYCVDLYELTQQGEWSQARALFERLAPLSHMMYGRQLAANIKAALEVMGHPAGSVRAPLAGFSDEERVELEHVLITLLNGIRPGAVPN